MTHIDWENTEVLRTYVCLYQDQLPKTKEYLGYVIELLEELDGPEASQAVYHQIIRLARTLYENEGFVTNPPRFDPNLAYTVEGARYRDNLLALHRKLTNQNKTLELFTNTLVKLLDNYMRIAPGFEGETGYEIPLIQCIDAPKAVFDILEALGDKELATHDLFTPIRDQITQNLLNINEKKVVLPQQHPGSPREIIHAYLRHTPFEPLFNVTLNFQLPEETRFSGHWIISPTGRGKTNLLHSMLRDDFKKDACIILMDPKPELELIGPISEMKELKDRLVLIEPDPDYPLALNPLDIPNTTGQKKLEFLHYIIDSLLGAAFTPRQRAFFTNLLPIIIDHIPNPTLRTFREIAINGVKPYAHFLKNLDADDRHFIDVQFKSREYVETKGELMWRFDLLMGNRLLRAMVNSKKTKLDLAKLMDTGRVVCIDASTAKLGIEGSEFYQRVFIALVLAAAQSRKGRKPVYLYMDEAHRAISTDERISIILDECRSARVATILAHQRLDQIKSSNVLSALKNCAIRMTNADDDARDLKDTFRTETEALRALKVGQFATWTREMGNSPAVTLNIPLIKHDGPKLTPQEQHALREATRQAYCNVREPSEPTVPPPEKPVPQPEKPQGKKRMNWRK